MPDLLRFPGCIENGGFTFPELTMKISKRVNIEAKTKNLVCWAISSTLCWA